MISKQSLAAVALLTMFFATARAADHRVEPLSEAPPEEGASAEIRAQLAPSGCQVIRGTSRKLCDIWICKQWNTKADFQASNTILYPLEVGRLFGLIRFHRDGEDFRGQEIAKGVYTLRYAQQPVDGNHIGTSDTLDFLLLLPAEEDTTAEPIDEETLFGLSADAAGSTHPAMLSMLRDSGGDAKLPALRHDQQRDFWSVRLAGKLSGDEKPEKLVVEFVIVGVSEF